MTNVSAVFSEPPASTAYTNRRNKSNRFKPQSAQQKEQSSSQQQSSNNNGNDGGYTRRFKPKIQPSATEQQESTTSSFYKFKLNRQPGRWQYKTSPKPRVTIRKQNSEDLQPQIHAVTPSYEAPTSVDGDENQRVENETSAGTSPAAADSRSDTDADLDSSGSVNGDVLNDEETLDNAIVRKKLPVETLKVEISTPADFKDTYYEIATIKSPYTYQVSVKFSRDSFFDCCANNNK